MRTIRWGIIVAATSPVKSGPDSQAATRRSWRVMRATPRWPRLDAVAMACPVARPPPTRILAADIDAVYVAAAVTHKDYVAALRGGGKPGAGREADGAHGRECDAMIAGLRGRARAVRVAYYRRALPRFSRWREPSWPTARWGRAHVVSPSREPLRTATQRRRRRHRGAPTRPAREAGTSST